MADNKKQFQCSGNCLNCLPAQRTYCASQHAYSNMKVLDAVMEMLNGMKEQISTMEGGMIELSEKLEAIQTTDADVFAPVATDEAPEEEGYSA